MPWREPADVKSTGSINMHRAAQNNLVFIVSPSSSEFADAPQRFGRGGLYQHVTLQIIEHLFRERLSGEIGDALTTMAQNAYASRRLDLIEQASKALISLPLASEYNSAGRYFGALERIRRRDYDTAEMLLTSVLSDSPHRYTARATQSLGAVFHARGDLRSALELYIEAGRRSIANGLVDPLTALYAQQAISIVKGTIGDHVGALESLERTLPFARAVGSTHRQAYCHFLNSLAVELTEVGRIEQARRICEVTVSSPYAGAYPEWHETLAEIASKQRRPSRAVIAVPPLPRHSSGTRLPNQASRTSRGEAKKTFNLVSPLTRPPQNPSPEYGQAEASTARVLDFQQWKRRVIPDAAQLGALSSEQRIEMSTGEKLIRLMDLISHDDTDDETIDVILEAVEAIVLGRRGAS